MNTFMFCLLGAGFFAVVAISTREAIQRRRNPSTVQALTEQEQDSWWHSIR